VLHITALDGVHKKV